MSDSPTCILCGAPMEHDEAWWFCPNKACLRYELDALRVL